LKNFKPAKSQRRVIKKGLKIDVRFKPKNYSEEIFEIYKEHSLNRFGRDADKENFMISFYTESCPSLQSEYYLNNELFAAGFLDISDEAMSTVYFIYKTDYEMYSPGIFSIIKEIEYAASLGLEYYYLGYYIEENQSMSYKNRFNPNEKFDWHRRMWLAPDEYLKGLFLNFI